MNSSEMIDWFVTFYFNNLRNTELFQNMENTVENSSWHREGNVLIHTDMVISQYINKSKEIPPYDNKNWLHGALAAAFHDVGKPEAMEQKVIEDGRTVRTFKGHELISARHWEDYVVSNWGHFSKILKPNDIWAISWLIEHHLPYNVKKDHKLNNIYFTANQISKEVFISLLLADCWGRISDDHEEKKQNVRNWVSGVFTNIQTSIAYGDFLQYGNFFQSCDDKKDAPVLYVLIGPSGCGKTTFSNSKPNAKIHSMDSLRLEWYSKDYSEAYKMSCEDSNFNNKVQKHFGELLSYGHEEIIIDNTNLSAKRRRQYVEAASRKGYKTIGVVFPISRDMLLKRQHSRVDKTVPKEAVLNHYNSLQQPSYGEFDEIVVCSDNLP